VEIRTLHTKGRGYASLAKQFDTRPDTIRNLCLGYTYQMVGGPLSPRVKKFTPTPQQIREIRKEWDMGVDAKTLSTRYPELGMSSDSIKRIGRRLIYKNVRDEPRCVAMTSTTHMSAMAGR